MISHKDNVLDVIVSGVVSGLNLENCSSEEFDEFIWFDDEHPCSMSPLGEAVVSLKVINS